MCLKFGCHGLSDIFLVPSVFPFVPLTMFSFCPFVQRIFFVIVNPLITSDIFLFLFIKSCFYLFFFEGGFF